MLCLEKLNLSLPPILLLADNRAAHRPEGHLDLREPPPAWHPQQRTTELRDRETRVPAAISELLGVCTLHLACLIV